MDSEGNEEYRWFSIMSVTQRVWDKLFTRSGSILFCVFATACGVAWYSKSDQLWMILLSPFAIAVFALALFLMNIVAIFGDEFADWALRKAIKTPDSRNLFHRLLYFFLSSVGFVLAAVVLGLGDPDVRGFWKP
ncbi:MAG: hypothetical protein ACRDAM_14335 [Casimicrobium sp.]